MKEFETMKNTHSNPTMFNSSTPLIFLWLLLCVLPAFKL